MVTFKLTGSATERVITELCAISLFGKMGYALYCMGTRFLDISDQEVSLFAVICCCVAVEKNIFKRCRD